MALKTRTTPVSLRLPSPARVRSRGRKTSAVLCALPRCGDEKISHRLNQLYEDDGEIVFSVARKLGCEGIVSKRLGSIYRSGRSPLWLKVKNPDAPAVRREAEQDWEPLIT